MARVIVLLLLAGAVLWWLSRQVGSGVRRRRAAELRERLLLARTFGLTCTHTPGNWHMEGVVGGCAVKLWTEHRAGDRQTDSYVVVEVGRPAPGAPPAPPAARDARQVSRRRIASAPSFDLKSGCWMSEIWTGHGLPPGELEAALTETLAAARGSTLSAR
jgi:hypothetical protein